MAPAYSESDTHDFAKSCVSFSDIGMSIHKLPDLRSVLRTGTVKNVYEKQRTDDPYTTGPASSAQHAQSHNKSGLLFCPGSASAVAGPLHCPGGQLQSGATGWQTPFAHRRANGNV